MDITLSNPPLALDSVTDAIEQTVTANAAQIRAFDSTGDHHLDEEDAKEDDDLSLPELIDVHDETLFVTAPRLHEKDEPGHLIVHPTKRTMMRIQISLQH